MKRGESGKRTKQWKMICIRKTTSGPTDAELEEAVFHYGRSTYEVEGGWTPPWESSRRMSPVGKMPDGLRFVIEDSGLSEASLETGIEIHIRNKPPGEDQGWHRFDYLAMMSRSGSMERSERYCYVSETTGEALEVVRLDDESEMPRKIWIKANCLPEETMAWAVGREILDLGLGRGQTTLQEYCDLGCSDPATRGAKEIPLPGPSPERRGCC